MRFDGTFFRKGMIMEWSGSVATIPAGWVFCNGSNGTPDLCERFVLGAGSIHNPDDKGGSNTHSHFVTGDGHTHSVEDGFDFEEGSMTTVNASWEAITGNTNLANNLPKYYTLAYIMKV